MLRRRNSSSGSKALSIVAILFSIAALAVSLYQFNLLRKQQSAANLPYLEPAAEHTSKSFALLLQNKGTAPAIIKNIRLKLDGKEVGNYQTFLEELLQMRTLRSVSIAPVKNSVLSASEKVRWLEAQAPDTASIRSADFAKRASLEICYCSLGGDCWQYLDGKVRQVEDCQ
ncbi:MAG: hypothetical protein AAB316_22235 [Bacteroidota bacterium]